MVDAPAGGGKIPVGPNYLISSSDHKIALRNFEGYISTYEEPENYQRHDPATCSYCQHRRAEPGQTGIHGLLEGDALNIIPEKFLETHSREDTQHRLRLDDSKWKPLGIGSDE